MFRRTKKTQKKYPLIKEIKEKTKIKKIKNNQDQEYCQREEKA